MQPDHVLKKLNFDLLTPTPRVKGGGGGSAGKICCCIRDFILFDMQHDHVLKKLNFDPG